MTWNVRFSVEDRVRISAAAEERRRKWAAQGRTQAVPDTDQSLVDMVGLAGEWAFYKAVLGLEWVEPAWCASDVTIGDCRVDIKSTWREDGNLLVTPNNTAQDDCDVYVLVRVDADVTEATMVGWQYAKYVRKAEFLTKLRSWVFLYPAEKLQPMHSLLEVG
jgi:hypothetical protein